MTDSRANRTFLATAAAAGGIFGTYAVALPLYANTIGQAVSITGALLAIATVAVALGSLAAGLAVGSIDPRSLPALGMAIAGSGELVLFQGSFAAQAFGSILIGSGLGVYWAGSQAILGAQSGQPGSERGFINQFVIYTLGTVSSSIVSGALSSLSHAAGLSLSSSTRAGFVLGVTCAALALYLNRMQPLASRRAARVATITVGTGRDALLQLTDLCLVSALAFILALAPVILSAHFGFDSLQVGLSYGCVSLAKMGGSFFAGRTVRLLGHRRAITVTLLAATLLSLVLGAVRQPVLFVIVLVFAGMTAGGVWPVVVDATLASARPDRRAAMALSWSAREYPIIALATVGGGWLLGAFQNTTVLYLITAGLLAVSALSSLTLHGPAVRDDDRLSGRI